MFSPQDVPQLLASQNHKNLGRTIKLCTDHDALNALYNGISEVQRRCAQQNRKAEIGSLDSAQLQEIQRTIRIQSEAINQSALYRNATIMQALMEAQPIPAPITTEPRGGPHVAQTQSNPIPGTPGPEGVERTAPRRHPRRHRAIT